MKPGHNCKHGSAWHEWQIAGESWRKLNPTATADQARWAADDFASIPGWPDAGRHARYRAFLECAS